MYEVYCGGKLIYDDAVDDLKITNAKITLELGKTGSFEFTIYPNHPNYDAVVPLLAMVTVFRNFTETIFSGRVLNIKYGFHNEKQVSCEGELAFLLDSIIMPHYFYGSFSEYLESIIDKHNQQVEESKRFQKGAMTVGDFTPFEVETAEYKSALDTLNERMVTDSSYLSVRNQSGIRYLDLLSYEANATPSNQSITFGVNLLDVTRETNSDDVFSIIIPLGAKVKGEERLTVTSHNGGVPYIENANAIAQYGRIYRTVVFDNITVGSTLLSTATNYLADNYAGISSIEFSAVDLAGTGADVDAFKVGQWVEVHDQYHFKDWSLPFMIRKIAIDLQNPGNTKITIGKVQRGITEAIAEKGAEGGSSNAEQPYLLESGTTGIWSWKKFSDGTGEFFGKVPITSADVTTPLGNWYRGQPLYEATTYQYPFTMKEAPALNVTFQTRNGLGAFAWVYSDTAENAQSYLPLCYLIRPTTATGIFGNINIIAKGKLQ